MIVLAILSALAGSVCIALLSRHLARLDEARDGIPPSFITYGDEP